MKGCYGQRMVNTLNWSLELEILAEKCFLICQDLHMPIAPLTFFIQFVSSSSNTTGLLLLYFNRIVAVDARVNNRKQSTSVREWARIANDVILDEAASRNAKARSCSVMYWQSKTWSARRRPIVYKRKLPGFKWKIRNLFYYFLYPLMIVMTDRLQVNVSWKRLTLRQGLWRELNDVKLVVFLRRVPISSRTCCKLFQLTSRPVNTGHA